MRRDSPEHPLTVAEVGRGTYHLVQIVGTILALVLGVNTILGLVQTWTIQRKLAADSEAKVKIDAEVRASIKPLEEQVRPLPKQMHLTRLQLRKINERLAALAEQQTAAVRVGHRVEAEVRRKRG